MTTRFIKAIIKTIMTTRFIKAIIKTIMSTRFIKAIVKTIMSTRFIKAVMLRSCDSPKNGMVVEARRLKTVQQLSIDSRDDNQAEPVIHQNVACND